MPVAFAALACESMSAVHSGGGAVPASEGIPRDPVELLVDLDGVVVVRQVGGGDLEPQRRARHDELHPARRESERSRRAPVGRVGPLRAIQRPSPSIGPDAEASPEPVPASEDTGVAPPPPSLPQAASEVPRRPTASATNGRVRVIGTNGVSKGGAGR